MCFTVVFKNNPFFFEDKSILICRMATCFVYATVELVLNMFFIEGEGLHNVLNKVFIEREGLYNVLNRFLVEEVWLYNVLNRVFSGGRGAAQCTQIGSWSGT